MKIFCVCGRLFHLLLKVSEFWSRAIFVKPFWDNICWKLVRYTVKRDWSKISYFTKGKQNKTKNALNEVWSDEQIWVFVVLLRFWSLVNWFCSVCAYYIWHASACILFSYKLTLRLKLRCALLFPVRDPSVFNSLFLAHAAHTCANRTLWTCTNGQSEGAEDDAELLRCWGFGALLIGTSSVVRTFSHLVRTRTWTSDLLVAKRSPSGLMLKRN